MRIKKEQTHYRNTRFKESILERFISYFTLYISAEQYFNKSRPG